MEFLVGRLHLTGTYDAKITFLEQAFSSGKAFQWHGANWKTINVTSGVSLHSGNQHSWILGILVKYRDQDERVFDDIADHVTIQVVRNKFIDAAYFVVDIKTSLIAYQVNAQISDIAARKSLAGIVVAHRDGFFINADIEPVLRRREFIEQIREMEKIDDVSIALHPSNPKFIDRWAVVDSELQVTQTDSLLMRYFPRKGDGLVIPDNSNLMRSLFMVADGYGRATIKGLSNKTRTILRSTSKAWNVLIGDDSGEADVRKEAQEALIEIQDGIEHEENN